MRRITLLAFLASTAIASVASEAHADEPDMVRTFNPTLRNVGIVSTAVGGAALVASPWIAIFGMFANDFSTPRQADVMFGLSVAALATGVIGLAFGIPAIAVGNHKTQRAAAWIMPGPTGVVVRF